jgi:hypothetical protein
LYIRVNEKPYVQGQDDTMFKRVNEKPYVQGQDDTMIKRVNEKLYVQGQDDTMIKRVNGVRIIFVSCHICILPLTGFELTPLIHCSTNRLALCPAPYTTRPHQLHKNGASIMEALPFLVRKI